MKYNRIDLVKSEAANIKKYATLKELNNLDSYTLDPTLVTKCVYGQLTGSCLNKRANELIVKCCPMVYKTSVVHRNIFETNSLITPYSFSGIDYHRLLEYISPIEKWIYDNKEKPKQLSKLIAYLKGQSSTLNI